MPPLVNHLPPRWTHSRMEGEPHIIWDDHDRAVAVMAHHDDATVTAARARRIVASVNALAGLPVEEIEAGKVLGTALAYAEACQQRDALLRACEDVLREANLSTAGESLESMPYAEIGDSCLQRVCAAIALARPPKPGTPAAIAREEGRQVPEDTNPSTARLPLSVERAQMAVRGLYPLSE